MVSDFSLGEELMRQNKEVREALEYALYKMYKIKIFCSCGVIGHG